MNKKGRKVSKVLGRVIIALAIFCIAAMIIIAISLRAFTVSHMPVSQVFYMVSPCLVFLVLFILIGKLHEIANDYEHTAERAEDYLIFLNQYQTVHDELLSLSNEALKKRLISNGKLNKIGMDIILDDKQIHLEIARPTEGELESIPAGMFRTALAEGRSKILEHIERERKRITEEPKSYEVLRRAFAVSKMAAA